MAKKSGQENRYKYWKNWKNFVKANLVLEKSTLRTGTFKQLLTFGLHIEDTDLAIVACRLYREALAPSSRSTYSTGVNHLRKFTKKYNKIPFPHENFEPPSYLSLSLTFFAAYLFETDSIRAYGTIRNYMSQVKQVYLKRGHPKRLLDSHMLKTVMKGIKRCMPQKPDTRIAFLLIHYRLPPTLQEPKTPTEKRSIAAIVFGFFAMLRFHSYEKFRLSNLTIVLRGGREIVPTMYSTQKLLLLLHSTLVLGFYFTFDDKFHPGARAYLCKLADVNRRLSLICPVRYLLIVLEVSQKGLFFPPNEISRTVLTKDMKRIACVEKYLKPHSLRIGGHTYYTVYGLDSDFRDYLACRKVKGATQTYYRASPALNLYRLREFFKRIFK